MGLIRITIDFNTIQYMGMYKMQNKSFLIHPYLPDKSIKSMIRYSTEYSSSTKLDSPSPNCDSGTHTMHCCV